MCKFRKRFRHIITFRDFQENCLITFLSSIPNQDLVGFAARFYKILCLLKCYYCSYTQCHYRAVLLGLRLSNLQFLNITVFGKHSGACSFADYFLSNAGSSPIRKFLTGLRTFCATALEIIYTRLSLMAADFRNQAVANLCNELKLSFGEFSCKSERAYVFVPISAIELRNHAFFLSQKVKKLGNNSLFHCRVIKDKTLTSPSQMFLLDITRAIQKLMKLCKCTSPTQDAQSYVEIESVY